MIKLRIIRCKVILDDPCGSSAIPGIPLMGETRRVSIRRKLMAAEGEKGL
jgi:hypothetical protein